MAVRPRDGWPKEHDTIAKERGHVSWEHWIAGIEDEVGQAICGGRVRTGHPKWGKPPRPCTQTRVGENGRCRRHLKNAPWGPFHYAHRGKGTSRYLPDRLRARAEEIDVKELLTLLDHMRVAAVLVFELLEKLDTGESGAAWEQLREAYREVRRAARADDMDLVLAVLDRMEIAIEHGNSGRDLREEIRVQQDHLRRLFESQTARDKVEMEYMHRREVLALFGDIARDIAEVVGRDDERRELANRMKGRLGPFPPGATTTPH